jgi:hypothetical protein
LEEARGISQVFKSQPTTTKNSGNHHQLPFLKTLNQNLASFAVQAAQGFESGF